MVSSPLVEQRRALIPPEEYWRLICVFLCFFSASGCSVAGLQKLHGKSLMASTALLVFLLVVGNPEGKFSLVVPRV
jgi:hypothetical protein